VDRKKKIVSAAAGALLLAGAAAAGGLVYVGHRHGPFGADRDGDAQITAREIAATARARFAERDANGDGKLTGDEVPRHRHGHGGWHGGHENEGRGADAAAQPGQADESALDATRDGAVTLPEFYRSLRMRLLRADSNGDGALSAAELAAARPRHRGDRSDG
jgi:hypothetical protein